MDDCHFNIKLAASIGMSEAIMLRQIKYWCKQNEKNGINFRDGCYWMYNTLKDFHKFLPFMSERTIRSALSRLKKEGLIKTGCFNQNPRDRTMWYALTEKGDKSDVSPMWQNLPHASGENCHMQEEESATSIRQNLPHASDKNAFSTNNTNKYSTKDTQNTTTPPTARAREEEVAKAITVFADNIHLNPSPIEIEDVTNFVIKYSLKWTLAAIREAVECNVRSTRYMAKILERWGRDGFMSPKPGKKEGGSQNGRRTSGHTQQNHVQETEGLRKLKADARWVQEHQVDPWDVQPDAGGAGAES